MKMSRWIVQAVAVFAIPVMAFSASAQSATTASVSGIVRDATGAPRADARVVAVHTPSGSTYSTASRQDGRFAIPGMRVGGPYTIRAMSIGHEPDVKPGVFLSLGVATELQFNLRTAAVQLAEIRITGESEATFSSDRTGAATSVTREAIATLPTISGRIEDFIRLTPQYSGAGFGFSFAGQDNRLNNVMIDGSFFNNSFGLAGQPGDRTGVAPISMDAIEQVQVNIAPYDVRQGNFIGAGVNTVTRSGTNEFRGSVLYQFRDERPEFQGARAGDNRLTRGEFKFQKIGFNFGGPIIQDKLFFFVNFEDDGTTQPGTTFSACGPTDTGCGASGGSKTRVLQADLDALSTYLSTNFSYATGPYQGYDFETPGRRYLAKIDYNLNERNKFNVRYSQLDSYTDVLLSNSSSLGFGTRRSNTTGLNFANSNYQILENIKSLSGELNTIVGKSMSNNLIVGYSHHDESRNSKGTFFPMVDVLSGGSVYTTFGFEPFTPSNELRYGSWQLQNNFTYYGDKHEITVGASGERYESENVFFPGSQSAYVYNSLADFYTDANDQLANPNRTVSPVRLRRFQVRWSNIPGQTKPVQPLEVTTLSAYLQDQWRINDKLRVVGGIRLDRSAFANTAFVNTEVDGFNFRDENGATVKYSTSKLPDSKILYSPRLGFNYDVYGDKTFQVRGGTGLFSGRPAYVWISNQIGENGVLTGFERLDDATATPLTSRPFHPDPNHYKPASVTGAPASSYGLAFTDNDFKFLQLWRTNIAADKRLPWGLVGTGEFLYSKDVNGVYYINANLTPADGAFTGADPRPRWTVDDCPTAAGQFTGNEQRLNCKVTDAIVLKNQDVGYAWNAAASIEKPFGLGTFVKAAYSYGVAKNTVDAGSIAFGSWNNNQHAGDPNNPGTGFAATSPGHRLFVAGSVRRQFLSIGATTAAIFWEMRNNGSSSYAFSGDLNGDGGTSNDLIYIPRNQSEMNFEQFTSGATTFTVQQQQDAWEAFINQDEYLSAHRGEYAERGAVFVPFVRRADVSIAQEIAHNIMGYRNGLEVRLDFLNFGNLLNHNWGVGQRLVTTTPLIARGADASGAARYRLRNIGSDLISRTFEPTAGFNDVYRIQLQLRYNFN